MAKDKQAVRNTYPGTILKRVRDGTHLLPHEDADDFLLLFEGLNHYGNPKTELDHLVVYQAAVLTWNILRYHDMNTAILRNYQRVALEKLLRTTSTSPMIVGGAIAENMMRSDIQQNIERWFADPAAKSAMKKKLEQAGYPPNAVETEAFMLALPSLGQNDKLLA